MSMFERIQAHVAPKPPIIMVYGVAGIGKTRLAASSDRPIFLQTEDGMAGVDAPSFGLLHTFDEIMQAIIELQNESHDYKTVVLDSLDHLEPLVWAQTCADNKWADIEAPGYGRGYVAAVDMWRIFLRELTVLRNETGMSVVILAHSAVARFTAPETESYDRYVPKLHKTASALIIESMDAVLFANYRVSTVSSDAGFNKKITRAVGGGERVLYTEERPAYVCKNRYDMPATMPMTWAAIAEHIPAIAPTV